MLSHWLKLSPFWRFQLAGWLAFVIATFPLKFDLMGSIPGALLLCISRDGCSFLLTVGMRSVYRAFWSDSGIKMGTLIVIACTIAAVLQSVLIFLIRDFVPMEGEIHLRQPISFSAFYERTGLFYGWSFLYFGIRLHIQGQEREAKLARVEAENMAAELRFLRAIMNPHFLFNALNFLKSQLLGKYDDLAQLVQAFTNYLRYALITRNDTFVEVGQEFDAVESYLQVEKARLGSEIEVRCHIDPEARLVMVPGVIIQPFVENAIKHGRRQLDNIPLKIDVLVARVNDELCLEVRNSGKWQAAEVLGFNGVGLKSLQERLRLLYGDTHRFEILNEGKEVVVRVNFPVHLPDHAD